jgi:hypothetical protein
VRGGDRSLRRVRSKWLAIILALFPGGACLGDISGPEAPPPGDFTDADLRVLFVGNSLTYTNNLPGLVLALANAGGKSVSQVTIAWPGFSLEDHWHNGLAAEIRRLKPDVIVMQQGPSSLPESRSHLVFWAGQVAITGREVGAEPALLMVWPEAAREFAFPDVAVSYATAAAEASGLLVPAGGTWLKAWELNPSLGFYGGDGFHPSYLGTLAAAHTLYAVLFEVEPGAIPELADGVPSDVLDVLHAAVAASLSENWLAVTSAN